MTGDGNMGILRGKSGDHLCQCIWADLSGWCHAFIKALYVSWFAITRHIGYVSGPSRCSQMKQVTRCRPMASGHSYDEALSEYSLIHAAYHAVHVVIVAVVKGTVCKNQKLVVTATLVAAMSTTASCCSQLARVHALPECERASVKTARRHTSAKTTISLYISPAWQ